MNELSRRESTIDALVQRGETSAAIALVLELITALAAARNFAKAELLRDRLYEIDPMALQEILKAGEIIEAEKSRGLDTRTLSHFGALTENLSSAETNALYYALKERQCHPAEVVYRQGDRLQHLYLVQSGQLRLLCRQGSREAEIAMLQPGDIAAAETFFSATLSTMSLVSVSAATLFFLEKEVLHGWETDVPALRSKLLQFCQKHRKVPGAPGTSNPERRNASRFALSGSILFQVLGPDGQAIGKPLRGELADIAPGGISFFFKTAVPRHAELLLGRQLGVRFTLPAGQEKGRVIQASSLVVGVQHQMFNDYSVHLRFTRPLEQACLMGLTEVAAKTPADRK